MEFIRAKPRVVSLQLSFLMLALAGPVRAGGPTIVFNIPAGNAEPAIQQYYSQSKIQPLYFTEDLKSVTTNPVVGSFDASGAMEQMLKGTGLEFQSVNNYSAVVIKPSPRPAGRDAPKKNEDSDGSTVSVQDQLRQVVVTGKPEQVVLTGERLDDVVVTGTLIHGVLDVMSPLTFVTKHQMSATGYATVQDALQELTTASGAGPGEDSGGAGNLNRGVAANLRGLGAAATLVLANGHRQPVAGVQGDFVDISNIPWSAVDRIEVLPRWGLPAVRNGRGGRRRQRDHAQEFRWRRDALSIRRRARRGRRALRRPDIRNAWVCGQRVLRMPVSGSFRAARIGPCLRGERGQETPRRQ